MSLQTLYCNASCECDPDQCSLLTHNHMRTITEPHIHHVHSTVSTLVHIGYAMKSKYVMAQRSYYIMGVK